MLIYVLFRKHKCFWSLQEKHQLEKKKNRGCTSRDILNTRKNSDSPFVTFEITVQHKLLFSSGLFSTSKSTVSFEEATDEGGEGEGVAEEQPALPPPLLLLTTGVADVEEAVCWALGRALT